MSTPKRLTKPRISQSLKPGWRTRVSRWVKRETAWWGTRYCSTALQRSPRDASIASLTDSVRGWLAPHRRDERELGTVREAEHQRDQVPGEHVLAWLHE